jgi:GT2 family glycosyltransferase
MDASDALPGPDGTQRPDQPLVSVVIPAFNCASHIAEALESVFTQTWRNLEVIVVNDGSPDTAAMEDAMQPYLGRVIYLRQENRGPSAARNAGIHRARGPFIALLDSDDTWLPEHIAQQMELFDADPALGLVYSNIFLVRDGHVLSEGFDAVPQAPAVNLDSLLAEDCGVNTSSVVAFRQSILAAGGFDESLNHCEDFDLWLRMIAGGVRMAYDRRVQARHRLGNGLSSDAAAMKRGRLRAYDKIAAITNLTMAQQATVSRKQRELQAGIQIEGAKRGLEEGRFNDSSAALKEALRLDPSAKLRCAALGMKISPRLLRTFYHVYLRVLAGGNIAKTRKKVVLQPTKALEP